MALIQQAPKNQAEVDASLPLTISPDQVLEMDEKTWYEQVYRGDDVPQLTLRAVAVGSVLGFFLAFTNLYIGLKTGWGLGVAITAGILSYAFWNVALKLNIAKTPMTILETNCMASTASSAGYATGGTMVSAIAALLMLSATPENPEGQHLAWPVLAMWTFFLGALGTVIAIPMKRNMINQERLKFPSGTAAAVTLQSLYSEAGEAAKKAKALLVSGLSGALISALIDLKLKKTDEGREALLPADSPIFDWLPARGTQLVDGKEVAFKPSDWTMVMDHNPVMIAAGALVGLRVTIYMALGGLLLIYAVGPAGYENLWTNPLSGEEVRATTAPYRAWKEIGLWLGVPIMVSSGLMSFALQWKTILRAFQSILGGNKKVEDDRVAALVARTEVPFSWFMAGSVVSGLCVVWVAHTYFEIPVHYGILAVILTFVLSLVACRATGESDITPVGAMGKLMQLTYGVLIPQSTTANLMTASITASAAGSAADLLNDLKSGYLLGANPRRQFAAQFAGIFTGTFATVLGWYLLVPDATVINGVEGQAPRFPAPAAQAWRAVAEVFRMGIDNMHPMHRQAIFWGLAIGTALVLLELALPKFRKFLPSATGLGLGLILPFQYPLSMLIGAIIGFVWTRQHKATADEYLVPVSAGIIAGLSLMGVLSMMLNTFVLS